MADVDVDGIVRKPSYTVYLALAHAHRGIITGGVEVLTYFDNIIGPNVLSSMSKPVFELSF